MKKSNLFFAVLMFGISVDCAMAVQAPNSRSSGVALQSALTVAKDETPNTESSRNSKKVSEVNSELVSRSGAKKSSVRTAVNSNSVVNRSAVKSKTRLTAARSATAGAARSSVKSSGQVARSAKKNNVVSNSARAARATAVFNDVSKIGGGYGQCRDSYNTCMDQFCANANDTYRRCYCSEKLTQFRDTEAALDAAKTLLKQFEDNNLNAVDKTAAEVNAMYSATVGEAAIKNDTSGAASILSEIGDLLSGKKKASSSASSSLSSAALDFSSEIGDIWGGNSDASSMFGGSGSTKDISSLEGAELYKSADKQCSSLLGDTCKSDAIVSMTKSAYSILIGQDCNAYEKNIETKKQAVEKTVGEAEKILRDARLEEYKSHNSADVNQCISKIKESLMQDTACGENYARCMDYTGLYINQTTGEPIYSAHLQDLPKIIQLDGANGNVLKANDKFNDFLDDKRMFAEKALDTCRDKAEVVWTEFKRSALIEIAQAQDAKLEEVKDGCVDIMKECYDKQSGALAEFDDTTAQYSAALGARASRAMCADKVAACAAVYADANSEPCEFDKQTGKLKNTQCGLSTLLAFVSAVDDVKVAEGCESGLNTYVQDLCKPAASDTEHSWPYGCRLRSKDTIVDLIQKFAISNCGDPTKTYADFAALAKESPNVGEVVTSVVDNLAGELGAQLRTECLAVSDESKGIWDSTGYTVGDDDIIGVHPEWLSKVFGGIDLDSLINTGINNYTVELQDGTNSKSAKGLSGATNSLGWGVCVKKTIKQMCNSQNSINGLNGTSVYNSNTGKCELNDNWYKSKCEQIGGYWEDNACYSPE